MGGDIAGLLETGGGAELGRRQSGVDQHLPEGPAVLGEVDGLRRVPTIGHRHSPAVRLGPAAGSAPELDDHAHDARTALPGNLLGPVRPQDVLEGQRFEVQPVAVS